MFAPDGDNDDERDDDNGDDGHLSYPAQRQRQSAEEERGKGFAGVAPLRGEAGTRISLKVFTTRFMGTFTCLLTKVFLLLAQCRSCMHQCPCNVFLMETF